MSSPTITHRHCLKFPFLIININPLTISHKTLETKPLKYRLFRVIQAIIQTITKYSRENLKGQTALAFTQVGTLQESEAPSLWESGLHERTGPPRTNGNVKSAVQDQGEQRAVSQPGSCFLPPPFTQVPRTRSLPSYEVTDDRVYVLGSKS